MKTDQIMQAEQQMTLAENPSVTLGDAEALYAKIRNVGSGLIADASDLTTYGSFALFAGTLAEPTAKTRICSLNLQTGELRVLTVGPNTDRCPKVSPDGKRVAFLSDRDRPGDFQLYFIDLDTLAVHGARAVDGWIEYLHWHASGKRILLGVASRGADLPSAQGATQSELQRQGASWTPDVDTGNRSQGRRKLLDYCLADDAARPVHDADVNVWDAVWCGPDYVVASLTAQSTEGHWYRAKFARIEVSSGAVEILHSPTDQIGSIAASPSGRYAAMVEAIASDRGVVAGALRLIDLSTRSCSDIPTGGIDVGQIDWPEDQRILLVGFRGFTTICAWYEITNGVVREFWSADETSTVGRLGTAASVGTEDCVIVAESFQTSPVIMRVGPGRCEIIKSFDLGYNAYAEPVVGGVEPIVWQAPDGLDIQGWMLTPKGSRPYSTILHIHGGPVSQWRPTCLARARNLAMLMLLERGFAVLLPNPRGSAGRGSDFAAKVFGDMGGEDTFDHLAGLDHLIASGLVDATRIGVTGGSYGGFMTCWLTAHDQRFAAAVAVAPVTNWITEHLLSNIPEFVSSFLGDPISGSEDKYQSRSPLFLAERVSTPTLSICGAKDRCTPATEAVQFHNALVNAGTRSILVTYPEEGHGVRNYPAFLDCAARVTSWFVDHMPSGQSPAQ